MGVARGGVAWRTAVRAAINGWRRSARRGPDKAGRHLGGAAPVQVDVTGEYALVQVALGPAVVEAEGGGGGQLTLESSAAEGTTATVVLPRRREVAVSESSDSGFGRG